MSSYKNIYNEDSQSVNEVAVGGKFLIWGIVVLVVCGILGGAWWVTDNRFAVATQPLQAQREKVALTVNGANELESQKMFFSKYNTIVSLGKQIKQSQDALADFEKNTPKPYNYADSTQRGNLMQTVQGQKSLLQSTVSEYNTASDSDQQGRYRDQRLPAHLDPSNPPTETIN